MGNVHARVTNKSGGVVTLLLDEKDERLEYFKKLVKRDELESVEVSTPPAKKAAAAKPTPAKGAGSASSSD